MPSKSKKQKKFMQAACYNKEFAKKANIKQDVACEFVKHDKKLNETFLNNLLIILSNKK